jgi:hypothetical protein
MNIVTISVSVTINAASVNFSGTQVLHAGLNYFSARNAAVVSSAMPAVPSWNFRVVRRAGPQHRAYAPSSGSLDSIRAAVALADTGDTVCVPAGIWGWKIWAANTPSLTLLKPICLKGAGHESTVIIGDTASGGNERLIRVINNSGHAVRISGFKFKCCVYTNGSMAAIDIGNKNWRIDHCVFDTSIGTRSMDATGFGLVDSCYFYDHVQGLSCSGLAAKTDTYVGDSIWSADGRP